LAVARCRHVQTLRNSKKDPENFSAAAGIGHGEETPLSQATLL
jgi:hypothetical protein